jgi:spore photoproduct lyase
MKRIYIEEALVDNPRVKRIIHKYPAADRIFCRSYQEVFNPKSQNFRIQKNDPALILAEKRGRLVLPTPKGFGIGGEENYYFSHLLNCPYDCRYCFLQGMYQSANYVLFVNYEDFIEEIKAIVATDLKKQYYFFSGYDADSLALEGLSGFIQTFIPAFAKLDNAILELRTKSSNVKALLKYEPYSHCVVAFSFTPEPVSMAVEYKVPQFLKRLQALRQVAEHGWPIGLRFDPLIYASNFTELYQQLIDTLFSYIVPTSIHSVSVGPLRFPEKMYQKLVKLYPQDKLLAHPLIKEDNHYSYPRTRASEMQMFVKEYLQRYINNPQIFECHSFRT